MNQVQSVFHQLFTEALASPGADNLPEREKIALVQTLGFETSNLIRQKINKENKREGSPKGWHEIHSIITKNLYCDTLVTRNRCCFQAKEIINGKIALAEIFATELRAPTVTNITIKEIVSGPVSFHDQILIQEHARRSNYTQIPKNFRIISNISTIELSFGVTAPYLKKKVESLEGFFHRFFIQTAKGQKEIFIPGAFIEENRKKLESKSRKEYLKEDRDKEKEHERIILQILLKSIPIIQNHIEEHLESSIRKKISEPLNGIKMKNHLLQFRLKTEITLEQKQRENLEIKKQIMAGIRPSTFRYNDPLKYIYMTLVEGPYSSILKSRLRMVENNQELFADLFNANIHDYGGGDGLAIKLIRLRLIKEGKLKHKDNHKHKIFDNNRNQLAIAQYISNLVGSIEQRYGQPYIESETIYSQIGSKIPEEKEKTNYFLQGCTPNMTDEERTASIKDIVGKMKKGEKFAYDFFIQYQTEDKEIVGVEHIQKSIYHMYQILSSKGDSYKSSLEIMNSPEIGEFINQKIHRIFRVQNQFNGLKNIDIKKQFEGEIKTTKNKKKKFGQEKPSHSSDLPSRYFDHIQKEYLTFLYNNPLIRDIYFSSAKGQGLDTKEISFNSKFNEERQRNELSITNKKKQKRKKGEEVFETKENHTTSNYSRKDKIKHVLTNFSPEKFGLKTIKILYEGPIMYIVAKK